MARGTSIRSEVSLADNQKGGLNYELEKGISGFINAIYDRCGDLAHYYSPYLQP